MNKDKRIIEKQKEYIELLNKEINSLFGLAYVHGWRSNLVEEGQKLRDELQALESEPEDCHCGGYPDCICDITRSAELAKELSVQEIMDKESKKNRKDFERAYMNSPEPAKELFEKVYIRDQKDLPEEGKYHVHKLGDSNLRYIAFDSASFRQIKKCVDYYLKPLK